MGDKKKIDVVIYIDEDSGKEKGILDRYPGLDISKNNSCSKLNISLNPTQIKEGSELLKELIRHVAKENKVNIDKVPIIISGSDESMDLVEELHEHLDL